MQRSVIWQKHRLEGYTQADEQVLLRRLRDVVGESMRYEIVYPDRLEKGENGKFRLIVK